MEKEKEKEVLDVHLKLNEALGALNAKELDFLIQNVYIHLGGELKFKPLINQDYYALLSIVKLCVTYGIINSPRKSKRIAQLSNYRDQVMFYTAAWLKKLVNHRENPVSQRPAKKLAERDIVRDHALAEFLTCYYNVNNIPFSKDDLNLALDNHDLLMSIENLQGHLLEAYISSIICKPPYNFIWLDGEIVKATDFALEYDKVQPDGTIKKSIYLLQIKNKYNTENSSSVTVRDGTKIKIEKWYRLGKETIDGIKCPSYKWDELNKKIYDLCGNKPNLNEDDYINFLKNMINLNPKIINI